MKKEIEEILAHPKKSTNKFNKVLSSKIPMDNILDIANTSPKKKGSAFIQKC